MSEMDINLNGPLRVLWTLLWKLVSPAVLAFITILAWVNHEPMKYDNYQFPAGIEALGWIMELAPLAIVLLYPIIPFLKARKQGYRGKQLYDKMFQPTESWYKQQMDRRRADYFESPDNIKLEEMFDNEAFENTEEKIVKVPVAKEYKGSKEEIKGVAKEDKIDDIEIDESDTMRDLDNVIQEVEQQLPIPDETIDTHKVVLENVDDAVDKKPTYTWGDDCLEPKIEALSNAPTGLNPEIQQKDEVSGTSERRTWGDESLNPDVIQK